jgi:hypothetical protein
VLKIFAGQNEIFHSLAHRLAGPGKESLRLLAGQAGLKTSVIGAAIYANKFYENPDLKSAMGLAAYVLYGAENAALLMEATKPKLTNTSLFGTAASALKMINASPEGKVVYAGQTIVTAVEALHNVAPAAAGSLIGRMQHAIHPVSTRQIALAQRSVGASLVAIGGYHLAQQVSAKLNEDAGKL